MDFALLNINPNIYTFTILVDVLCKEGKIKEARIVIGVMMKEGVEPTVVTWMGIA